MEFQVVACSQTSKPKRGKPSQPAISLPINGESWFAVETIDNLPWFMTNHAQPEPKRVAAAFQIQL